LFLRKFYVVECISTAVSKDAIILRKKPRLDALFAISVIEDSTLAYLLNDIIEMSTITLPIANETFSERRVKKINQKVYQNLMELRSQLTIL
jgi:hypothetical protein